MNTTEEKELADVIETARKRDFAVYKLLGAYEGAIWGLEQGCYTREAFLARCAELKAEHDKEVA